MLKELCEMRRGRIPMGKSTFGGHTRECLGVTIVDILNQLRERVQAFANISRSVHIFVNLSGSCENMVSKLN